MQLIDFTHLDEPVKAKINHSIECPLSVRTFGVNVYSNE